MNEALVWIKHSRSNIESCNFVLNIIFPGWNVEKLHGLLFNIIMILLFTAQSFISQMRYIAKIAV